jgi:recombinational DNA repair protein (RecF pathway)
MKCAICLNPLTDTNQHVQVADFVIVAHVSVQTGLIACLDCAEAWAQSHEAERVRSVATAALYDFSLRMREKP